MITSTGPNKIPEQLMQCNHMRIGSANLRSRRIESKILILCHGNVRVVVNWRAKNIYVFY